MAVHVIKKQVLEVIQKGYSNNHLEELSTNLHYKIVPVFQQVFDNFSNDNKTIRIDKLEIDLGIISRKDYEREFEKYVKEALTSKLESMELNSLYNDAENSFENITIANSKLDVIVFFLKSGVLPWWTKSTTVGNLDSIFEDVLDSCANDLKTTIKSEIHNIVFIKRLINQFSENIINNILLLLAEDKFEINVLIADLFRLKLHKNFINVNHNYYRNKLYLYLFNAAGSNETIASGKELLRDIIFDLSFDFNVNYTKLIEDFKIETPSEFSALFAEFVSDEFNGIKFIDNIKILEVPHEKKINIKNDPEILRNKNDPKTLRNKNDPGILRNKNDPEILRNKNGPEILKYKKEEVSENINEEYYIENSGLVILYPYISKFFSKLNLLNENDFRDLESNIKAVHLLQYIASGEFNSLEHYLVLNKLLCGMDISFPVERSVEINHHDTAEADSLMHSVIKNWDVIKNTSLNGFREAFLKRDGILINKDDKWILKVERKSYDILFEKIPWSFSVIRLPWMKKILYVEW